VDAPRDSSHRWLLTVKTPRPSGRKLSTNLKENKMSLDNSTFRKLVKQFGGFIESGIARFPSVHQYEQFLKAYAAAAAEKKEKTS
jgi:hypothetical protein